LEFIDAIPRKVLRGMRGFNARLVPPEKYMETIQLGMSVFEEIYFIAKNFTDGTVHVSETMLYEDNYHTRRLEEYRGQHRLVVFVPGYLQSPRGFYRLERFLGVEIFDAFTYIWGGFPTPQDLTLSAQQLERVLLDLARGTRVDEIYLVGHSQGGMIIRTMLQHGMANRLPIRKCLTLSSPHQGTWVALAALSHQGIRRAIAFVPYVRRVQGESGMQLVPGSDFLRELNTRPLPEDIRFASVYYAFDPMIWPPTNAVLPYPEAQNHFINKVGHAQPLYCSRATQIALRFLYGAEAEKAGLKTDVA
jgi:triacylglycerol esterase/lipase EstA (alpha/beta hydrolase family)